MPSRPGKAEEDRRCLLAKLAKLEQQVATADELAASLNRPHEADLREQAKDLGRQLRHQMEAVERCVWVDKRHGRYK